MVFLAPDNIPPRPHDDARGELRNRLRLTYSLDKSSTHPTDFELANSYLKPQFSLKNCIWASNSNSLNSTSDYHISDSRNNSVDSANLTDVSFINSDKEDFDTTSGDTSDEENLFPARLNTEHQQIQESFSRNFIQLPLKNNTRTKRLKNVRKQVRELSKAIKMTISNDPNMMSKEFSNPVPFSSHVNMQLLSNSQTSQSITPLPNAECVINFLQSGRKKEAKLLVRRSSWAQNHATRQELWLSVIKSISKDDFNDFFYWDTVQQVYGSKEISGGRFGSPAFVDTRHVHTYALSDAGVKSCQRIISVLGYNFPAITYAPLIFPLTAAFMHYMEEPDAYHCISSLLNKSSTYIPQTKILHETMWRTVEVLAKKYIKGSFSTLKKYAIAPEQISEGFRDWTKWLFLYLPEYHVIRIIDCYLIEGSKVLLRIALAIFDQFIRCVARDQNFAASLAAKGFAESIAAFCSNMQGPPSKLLKIAFGIRGFSSSGIKKVVIQTETLVKNDPSLTIAATSTFSNDGLPTSESQQVIKTVSHTLDIKEGAGSSGQTNSKAIENCPVKSIDSGVIDIDQLLQLWSWLPMRMTMHHPTLVYTTEEHGSSLTNFYLRVDNFQPTILLVRTISDEVFGAYCSTTWTERNECDEYGHKQTYFGTGETFLFTLRPTPKRYEWVGITRQRQDATLSSVAHLSQLFMHADRDMVSVGGGGSHGLMLDHDLKFGKTERCETFNNEPLCVSRDFEIKVVEVFSLGTRF